MKATSFCLFEYDDNKETLITFIYPQVEQDLKTVIQETASYLVLSNTLSLFSSYKSQFLYFDAVKNTDRSKPARVYGICIISEHLHPAMYSSLGQVLVQIYKDHVNPPKILRAFLATRTEGKLDYNEYEFDSDNFEDNCFSQCSFDLLLDRVGQYIPIIWQALVTGKSIAVYSPEIGILQNCAVQILALCSPGSRQLLPLVLENSSLQTEAAEEIRSPIWCSIDASVLSNRFDLVVDLSSRNVKMSQAFTKESGKSDLLERLMNSINESTSSEASVSDTIEQFNGQIISTLGMIKSRLGDLSAQSITSVNLPTDTKLILTAVASSGVFNI